MGVLINALCLLIRFVMQSVCAFFSYVVDELKVAVVRVISGSLITSLEMAGVSLTLLRLTPELLAYLGELHTLSFNHCA